MASGTYLSGFTSPYPYPWQATACQAGQAILPTKEYFPAMSIMRHRYTIEWAKTGQRKDDPPKEVVADDYWAVGDFFVFVQRHSNVPNDHTTVLTVRANDVASIEVGEQVER